MKRNESFLSLIRKIWQCGGKKNQEREEKRKGERHREGGEEVDKGGGWCAVEEKLDTQRYTNVKRRREERRGEERRGKRSAFAAIGARYPARARACSYKTTHLNTLNPSLNALQQFGTNSHWVDYSDGRADFIASPPYWRLDITRTNNKFRLVTVGIVVDAPILPSLNVATTNVP